jgi:hypothetical protein
MSDLTETLGRAGLNLDEALAGEDDLGRVQRAIVREQAIRRGMAKTGEGREVVAEMLDGLAAMDQEAVLDLAEGNPTTMADALARYIRILSQKPTEMHPEQVQNDLSAILEYPWSAEEEQLAGHDLNQSLRLEVVEGDDRDLVVTLGDNRWPVITIDYESCGSSGQRVAEEVARAVHRAVLARVIADRDHRVQINAAEAASLVAWAVNSSGGSWSPSVSSRLSVDAVSGGGWLVRTRPYAWQHQVGEERRRLKQEQDARNDRPAETWGRADG